MPRARWPRRPARPRRAPRLRWSRGETMAATLHRAKAGRVARLVSTDLHPLDFDLPRELEAGEPPEARGLARDEVCLMVSYRSDNRVVHSRFRDLGDFLDA